MTPIILHLTNLQPGANFIRVGIPSPQGAVTDCDRLKIVDPEGRQISSAIKCTARWPDSSVKWCLAKIALPDSKTPDLDLTIKLDNESETSPALLELSENTNGIIIQSGAATFEFAANTVFPSVTVDNTPVWQAGASYPLLVKKDGTHCDFEIGNISIDEQDNVSCRLAIDGIYQSEPNQILNAKFIFEVLPGPQLSLVCELHNAQRAIHSGGIWDLGDAGPVPGLFNCHAKACRQRAKTQARAGRRMDSHNAAYCIVSGLKRWQAMGLRCA